MTKQKYLYYTLFMLVIVPICTGLLFYFKVINGQTNLIVDRVFASVWIASVGAVAYKEKHNVLAIILWVCCIISIVLAFLY